MHGNADTLHFGLGCQGEGNERGNVLVVDTFLGAQQTPNKWKGYFLHKMYKTRTNEHKWVNLCVCVCATAVLAVDF